MTLLNHPTMSDVNEHEQLGKQRDNPRPDVRNPGDGQTPANNPSQNPQSQNVVPAPSTTVAYGGHGSSSSQATQDQDYAQRANAAEALLGIKGSSSESAPQTTARHPPPALGLVRVARLKPNPKERDICTNSQPKILEMYKTARYWTDMGHELDVRPGALKWMWQELKLQTEQNKATRKRAQVAAAVRLNREKAKESESGGK